MLDAIKTEQIIKHKINCFYICPSYIVVQAYSTVNPWAFPALKQPQTSFIIMKQETATAGKVLKVLQKMFGSWLKSAFVAVIIDVHTDEQCVCVCVQAL